MVRSLSFQTTWGFRHILSDTCLILVILLLLSVVSPVCGYIIPADIQSRLKSAFPTAGEATGGLEFSESPHIDHEDSQENYYYVTYGWMGYDRFTCPPGMKDGRIDKKPGDFFSVQITLNYIDNPASALTLTSPEVFREWIKGRVEPYVDYTVFPGGVIHEEQRDTEYDHHVEDWIAFWYDTHTYGEIRISATIRTNSLYDSNGCQPSVYERNQKIRALTRSEAERLSKLVFFRLSGGTGAETDLKTAAENRLGEVTDLYTYWSGNFADYVTGNAEGHAGGEATAADPKATAVELQRQAREFEKDSIGLFKVTSDSELFGSAASLITNTPQYSGYEAELWRRTKAKMEAKIAVEDYEGAIAVYDTAMATDRSMNEGWFGRSGLSSVNDVNTQPEQKEDTIGTVTQKTGTTITGKTTSY
ncbi:MAG: hypothetical protein LUQ50_11950 [Methanospirillum sp.]|uniref:hypothetical protein n=1 Tax=Methanospirillum sp. TaxID=45200 RepID=UPI0023744717|nr:hypothetical protein [Methanospirillum sp.]MDD1729768.1 hypothetical protein [Methanospirillum sp.]